MTNNPGVNNKLTRDEKIQALIEMQKEYPIGKPAVIISFEEYKRKYERKAAAETEVRGKAGTVERDEPRTEIVAPEEFGEFDELEELNESVDLDFLEDLAGGGIK